MTEILDAYCTPGTERETRLAPEDLLRQMDRARIRRAVIAPDDREIAVGNQSGNARIVQLARQHADRFWPACAVNPWYCREGVGQLRRAAAEGARILVLAPALQGFCLGDEVADDLLAAAAELDVPVYVHTGSHSHAAPTQLVLLASRHPRTRWILGHCGSTDYAWDMAAVLKAAPANVWFELSLVRPWAAAAYVKQSDRSRFLFGSSAPRNDAAFELARLDEHLPMAEYPDVYGGNLARLLKEAGS
jgi:predicted TIM-barrel fold metal-dependent hydrolase